MTKTNVLFVCLGNTCRSPMAEAVFLKLLADRQLLERWSTDSVALMPWHIGEPPNDRSMAVIQRLGITYHHVARVITLDDFRNSDFIFGMDYYNIERLHQLAPDHARAKIVLLGSFNPSGDTIIRDPYCDRGTEGFEKCYEQCLASCSAFLDRIYHASNQTPIGEK